MKKLKHTIFLFSLFSQLICFGQNSEVLRNQAMQYFDERKFTEALACLNKIKDKQTLENTNVILWKEHISDIQNLKLKYDETISNTLSIVSVQTALLKHYGLYDKGTKQFIIPPCFDEINILDYAKDEFVEVRKANKRGLCNLKGEYIIPLGYYTIYANKTYKVITTKRYNGVEPSQNLISSVYDWNGKLVLDKAEFVGSCFRRNSLIFLKSDTNLYCIYDLAKSKMVLENCSEIKKIPFDSGEKYDLLLVRKYNQSYYYDPKNDTLQANQDFDSVVDLKEEDHQQLAYAFFLKYQKGKKPEPETQKRSDFISSMNEAMEGKNGMRYWGGVSGPESMDFFLVGKNNKRGVFDMFLKKYVYPPVYDSIAPLGNSLKDGKWKNLFFEDLVADIFFHRGERSRKSTIFSVFSKNNKYGLKDEFDNIILTADYDEMKFDFPIVAYRLGKKWGFVGFNNSIVKPTFDHISCYNGLVTAYSYGKQESYYYDSKKKQYCAIVPKKETKKEVENKTSKAVLKTDNSDLVEYLDFDFDGDDDVNIGRKEIKKGNLYGIADSNNKEIVPPIYKSIFVVGTKFQVQNINNGVGLIDKNGKEIIPFHYKYIDHFQNNLFIVKNESKYGIFNTDENKEIVTLLYSTLEPISDDLFIVSNEQNLYGVIDKGNRVIYPFIIKTFDRDIVKLSSNDLFICSGVSDSNFSFSSLIRITNGKATNMFEGSELLGSFERSVRKIALVKKNGLICLYDLRKASFLGPQFKESIYIAETDCYLLKKDSLFDYQLDMLGKLTHRTKPIVCTWKGFSIYEENNTMGLINEKCEKSKATFPKVLYLAYNPYPKTLFRYYSDLTSERNGLIDFDGNIIVRAGKYDEIKPLSNIDLSFPNNQFTADEIKFIFMCTDKSNSDYNKIDYISLSGREIANLKIGKEFEWIYMRNKNGLLVFRSKEFIQIFDLKTNEIRLKTKSDLVDGNNTNTIITNLYHVDTKSGNRERRVQLINNKGNIVADESYTLADESSDHKSYGYYRTKAWINPLITKRNNKYGFITFDEKIIHPFLYDTISYIKNRVSHRNYYPLEAEKNNKKGILDNSGKIVLDFKYDKLEWVNLFENRGERDDERNRSAETFDIIVKESGKYGLLNSQLNTILPTEFDDVRIDGKIITSPIVARKNNYLIVFDSNGSYQFEVVCDSLRENLKSNYFEIFKGGKQGILDFQGNLVCDIVYPNVRNTEIENLFIIKKDNQEYLADGKGKILSNGFKEIKTIGYYKGGYKPKDLYYYITTKNSDDKIGIVDLTSKVIIPNQYDSITGIATKYIFAFKNGKQGIIDFNNNIVIPFKYSQIRYFPGYFECELSGAKLKITLDNVILQEN